MDPPSLDLEHLLSGYEHVSLWEEKNNQEITNRGRGGAAEMVDYEGGLDGDESSGAEGIFHLPWCNQAAVLRMYLLLGQLCRYKPEQTWIELGQEGRVIEPPEFKSGAYEADQHGVREETSVSLTCVGIGVAGGLDLAFELRLHDMEVVIRNLVQVLVRGGIKNNSPCLLGTWAEV